MTNIVYHGSPNGGIDEFKINESTHKVKCLYAAENKAVAMLFMGRGRGDLDTLVATQNGIPYIVERREGVLKSLYDHDGYLYEIDASTFKHEDYLWPSEVISTAETLKPINCTYYPNILEALQKEAENGNLKIYSYPNRPEYLNLPLDNSDLIEKYINFDKKGHKGAIDELIFVYPKLKDKVFSKLEMPKEFYYIDKKRESFDEIVVHDNIVDAFLRESSPVFVRENGRLNYNIVDSKFIFENGSFNFKDDFYIYKVRGNAKRLSEHSFDLDAVQIVSSYKLDLNDYLARKGLIR